MSRASSQASSAARQIIEVVPHIICVDDEEGILHALRQHLTRFEEHYEIDLATSGQHALDLIDALDEEGEPVAMVIADQIMPGLRGVELLEQVHRRHPRCIKILLTGQAGLDAVVHAINHAGLDRYIAKPWDEADLCLTVESLLDKYKLACENDRLLADLRGKNDELQMLNRELEARVRVRTVELAAANKRLAQLAITDGLTGKYNHRYFHDRLGLEVERSGRNNLPLSLLMIDVDHFKQFNDTHGHVAGDAALRQVAELAATERRINDIVARYGGEEFAVLLPDTPRDAAVRLAEQMRERVEQASFVGGDGTSSAELTISVGVAACPDDTREASELLIAADAALYRAKRGGRNQVALAEPGDTDGRTERETT